MISKQPGASQARVPFHEERCLVIGFGMAGHQQPIALCDADHGETHIRGSASVLSHDFLSVG